MLIDKLSKNEMRILEAFKEINSTDRFLAKKISDLSKQSNLSYFSVRNIVKSLYLSGLCEKGRKEGNADTYYLTELGQNIIRKEK